MGTRRSGPCDPSYPFQLGNIEADLDEIDTVVKYLQDLRGVDRVSFVGWSAAAPRIGAYAARHPEKVDKLFFYAPVYDPKASSRPPDILPTPGFPTRLRTRSQQTSWEGIRCQDQHGYRRSPVGYDARLRPARAQLGTT